MCQQLTAEDYHHLQIVQIREVSIISILTGPSVSWWILIVYHLIWYATTKSTLKLFNFEEFEIGKIHNIWKSCGSDLYAVKRACVNN
jgi:hypothetical protein